MGRIAGLARAGGGHAGGARRVARRRAVGEGDDDFVGTAGAGGEADGLVLFGGGGQGGEDLAQAGGEGEGAAESGGVGGAGEEQGEEVEEDQLERARNPDAVLPPGHGGRGERADAQLGLCGDC